LSDHDPPFDPAQPQGRIFLERRGYRQRRIIDAARMLPIVGLLLWLVPLVWPDGAAEGAISTSRATLYVFLIWSGLIALGGYLAWRMDSADHSSSNEADTTRGGDQ